MRHKRLVVACAAVFAALGAGNVAAQTPQDMMRQIESMQQQIDALKAQLQQMQRQQAA